MSMSKIDIRIESQNSAIADEVSALNAIVRPILIGLLYSLPKDLVRKQNGYDSIDLQQLARLRKQGDGDCGICYEYAVHEAIRNKNIPVIERVSDALKICKVPGNTYESILFGAEKNGSQQLIATAANILTDESRVLTGIKSQPPKLKNHLTGLVSAFRRPTIRTLLPTSINGLWKADLFIGCTDSDRWVGTSVKINPAHLEGAKGLRVAIIPSRHGKSDRVTKDDSRNLVICPLPYDGEFVEIFYHAWGIVQQFVAADARLPKEVALPQPSHRQVARWLEARRDYPVVDVVDALNPLAQPELLNTQESATSLFFQNRHASNMTTLITPVSREV